MELSRKTKIAYGVGAVGKDIVYAFVNGFLMYYYNTILGVSASFIGFAFMAARVFDALNDPVMGVIVEKTNTKLGKFRPWLLIGTFANAIVVYFLFAVPKSIDGNALLVYVFVGYVLWGVTYTIMDIPYWSMIPAITNPGKERENVSVIARSCAGVGFAMPTALTLLLVPILGKGSERDGFGVLALIISVIFIIAIAVTVINVKEKPGVKGEAPGVKEMLMSLFKNDQALVVVVAIIVFNSSLYLTQQLALYFFKFDIGNEKLFGLFGTIGGAAQILSMMSLPVIRKRFQSIQILGGAVITAMTGYLLLFFLGTFGITNIVLLCLAAVIIFIGFGLTTVLTTIFLADSIDYGELKNGSRNESVIFSLQTFVVKLASAFSVFIAGVGLDVIKLDTEAPVQSGGTLLGLRVLMTIIPMLGLIFSLAFFRRKYKLNEAKMEEINNELKKRREAKNND